MCLMFYDSYHSSPSRTSLRSAFSSLVALSQFVCRSIALVSFLFLKLPEWELMNFKPFGDLWILLSNAKFIHIFLNNLQWHWKCYPIFSLSLSFNLSRHPSFTDSHSTCKCICVSEFRDGYLCISDAFLG